METGNRHVRPKKRLGQNFLTDRNIAEKIVREVDPLPGELIIEIGPGEGALTGLLLSRGARVVAIEIDPEAAEHLRRQFGDDLHLIEADFLKTDLSRIDELSSADSLRVLGNIPYYITSPILFKLLESTDSVKEATLMMQKEVALRLVANRGTKDYGILTVTIQAYGRADRLFDVPRTCFYPRPNVTSSVVRITLDPGPRLLSLRREFHQLVRAAFGKRRKTLNNSLADAISDPEVRAAVLSRAGVDAGLRAERLSAEEFLDLAESWRQISS